MWQAFNTLCSHAVVGLQAMGLFFVTELLFVLLIAPVWLLSYRGLRVLNGRQLQPPVALQQLQGLLAWGILAVYVPVQRQRRMCDLRLLISASALAAAMIGGALRPDLQLALWTYTICIGVVASRPGLFSHTVSRLVGDR